MRARLIIGLALVILAVPLIFLGLIDPLEGGLALLAATVLGVVARVVSGVPLPRLAWISLAVAWVLAGLTLLLAAVLTPEVIGDTVMNPMASLPTTITLWLYRVAVLVVLVGAVMYAVRMARALSHPPTTAPSGLAVTVTVLALVMLTAVGAGVAVVLSRVFASDPDFPLLSDDPQTSLHGTVAYYSPETDCVFLIAASGAAQRQLWCLPAEPTEVSMAKGKPIGPHLAWLTDGRLAVTMYRMQGKPGPDLQPGWERIIDPATGAVEEVATPPSPPPQVSRPTTDPQAGTISARGEEGNVLITVRKDGPERVLLDVQGNPETYRLGAAFWAPGGQWIAADDGRILVITPDEPSRTWILVDTLRGGGPEDDMDRFAVTSRDLLG